MNDVNNNKAVYNTKGEFSEIDTNIICNNPFFLGVIKFCLSCNTGYSKIKVKKENQSCGNLLSCKRVTSQVVDDVMNGFMDCIECNDGYLRYKVSEYSYQIKGQSSKITVKSEIGKCSNYEDTTHSILVGGVSTIELKYKGSQTCLEGCKSCLYDSTV